tara:strand:- start:5850 stop:6071 length:222 start_codon:yes stop_codon:yes gene_type:complete
VVVVVAFTNVLFFMGIDVVDFNVVVVPLYGVVLFKCVVVIETDGLVVRFSNWMLVVVWKLVCVVVCFVTVVVD